MKHTDLKTALAELKWTQGHFAKRYGVDTDTVSRWTTGKTPVPPHVTEYMRVMVLAKDILNG